VMVAVGFSHRRAASTITANFCSGLRLGAVAVALATGAADPVADAKGVAVVVVGGGEVAPVRLALQAAADVIPMVAPAITSPRASMARA